MKVNAITIRPGHILEIDGKLWSVIKSDIMQPGKGASVVQVDMRDTRTGTKSDMRFRTQETVERVSLDEREYQYLYSEDGFHVFMNSESFEQINVPNDVVGNDAVFLQENMSVSIHTYEGEPLSVTLPKSVVLEVVEADPVVKGQTAAASYKPAILTNGVRVMVPPHVEIGTRIVVNIADRTYLERSRD